jgi:hypothetical protein
MQLADGVFVFTPPLAASYCHERSQFVHLPKRLMAGQGSLRRPVVCACCFRQVVRLRCAALACVFWLVPALLATLPGAEAPESIGAAGGVDVRLQWRFAAQQARRWNLRLALADAERDSPSAAATITEVENHCQSPTSTGAIRLSRSDRHVDFISQQTMSDGAIQFRVRGSRDSRLAIFLGGASGEVEERTLADAAMVVPLSQLLDGQSKSGSKSEAAGQSNVTWSLQRTPDDALRIELDDRSKWVAPGGEFSFAIRGNALVELASQSLYLRYELFRVGHGKVVAEQTWPVQIDAQGDTAAVTVTAAAPLDPGVYEIRCSITREEENLWSRLRRRDPPLLATGKPIVVLPAESPAPGESPEWKTVGEIRPSHAAAWSVSQWLPAGTNRLIPGSEPPADFPQAIHAGTDVSVIGPAGQFQATLPVATEGMPHKVTLRYPRGRAMRVRVDIAGIDSLDDPSTSFVLVEQETAHPDSPWSSHTFVHYPRLNEQLRLSNLDTSGTAAFESISVAAGPSHLSAARGENSDHRFAVLQLTDLDWIDSLSSDTLEQTSVASCQDETVARYRLWVAADRLRDYVVSCGMNAVSVPAVSEGHAWLRCQSFHAIRSDSRSSEDGLDAFLRLMSRQNLKVFVGVDAAAPLTAVAESIERDRSMRMASPSGESVDQPIPRYDALLPTVQAALVDLVGEVDRCAIAHPAYAGIVLQVGGSSPFGTGTRETIADRTLELFASSVAGDSVTVPQLRSWVAGPGKATFRQWQQSKWREFYGNLASSLGGKTLLLQAELGEDDRESLQAVVPANSNLVAMHNVRRVPVGPLSDRIDFQCALPLAESSSIAPRQAVNFGDSMPPDYAPIPVIRERSLTDISGMIDQFDPLILFVRSTEITGGLSSELADTLSAFCSLPDQTAASLAAADPAPAIVSVRSANRGEHVWLTVANRAPWPTTVDVQWTSVIDWQPGEGGELPEKQNFRVETSGPHVSVTLPGGRWMVLKSKSPAPGAAIKSWTSHVAGGQPALDAIKKDVSAIVSRLGMLSDWSVYPALSNGGFEQSGGVGLVGWLHAQHPPDSVLVDSNESVEGNRSVLLTTDDRFASRTWMVSETFAPPESGRLAVSLACRGELSSSGSDTAHRLRVSIEGTHGGQPLRESTEFDVPRDGKWQPRAVILQLDELERSAVQSLRLTIDSLSPGRVWIDDVRLHDSFPLNRERGELQSQAFLAVQGLQRGRLTPSARLLQNHWAKFLLHEAASQEPPTVIDSSNTRDETDDGAQGVTQRIRDWLPRPLRF